MTNGENQLSREQLLTIIAVQNEIVGSELDQASAMPRIARLGAEMTGADACVIQTSDGDELVYRAAYGTAAPHIGLRISADGSLSGTCLRSGVPLYCGDTEADPRADIDACRVVGARSMVCVPLLHHEGAVGVLKVTAASPHAFAPSHVALLRLLSGVIAAHLAHAAEFLRLDEATRRSQERAVGGLRALARAIDAKDPITRRHSDRVASLACSLARECGWSPRGEELLREAALLHDVGKIGVPDTILLKPGPLTPEEYSRVKQHASLGATIVEGVLESAQVDWIRWHHERPDGGGYPDGLTDPAIPEGAAIIALADSWDVMTVSRPYAPPVDESSALRECRRHAGRQFRESLVDVLTRVVEPGAGRQS